MWLSSPARFRAYAYKGTDASLVYKHALGPLANLLIHAATPRWLAPNAITLAGLLVGLSSQALLVATCTPSSVASATCRAPSYLYAYDAIAVLAYQTLDNMDGKQARRTNTSSPLGLLLDHGADALHAASGAIAASTVFQCTPWGLYAKFVCTVLPFYLATWEESHVGSFALPVVNGPTEGLLMLALLKALTAVVGPEWWLAPAPFVIVEPITRTTLVSENRDVLVLVSVAAAAGTVVASLERVRVEACRGSARELVSRAVDLAPLLFALALPAAYLVLLPVDAQRGGVAHVPWGPTTALAFGATGLCLCRLVAGMLVRHACGEAPLARSGVERATDGGPMVAAVAFAAAALGAGAGVGGDVARAWANGPVQTLVAVLFAWCAVGYASMVRSIIAEACDALGVRLLTIPSPKAPKYSARSPSPQRRARRAQKAA